MQYKNAKYINDNGWIDCEINHSVHGWIPYTLNPLDTDTTVNNDDLLAAMSANKDVAAYVAPTQDELDATSAIEVRAKRNYLLSSSVDPIVSNPLRWDDMSADKQAQWKLYRRALLDITEQADFPNVIWPQEP
tara:strand:- start:715 stop:1113 length:399 start_codon:yes stop_codon:yes gene_type:complete